MALKFWKRKSITEHARQPGVNAKLDCMESQASFLSRAFFCWVTPLLVHGWSTPVQLKSLPDIGRHSEMDPGMIAARFHTEWAKEQHRVKSSPDRRSHGQSRVLRALRQIALVPQLFGKIGACLFGCGRDPGNHSNATSQLPSLACSLYPLVSGYLARALFARLIAELIPVFIPILVKLTTSFSQHKRTAIKHALKAGQAAILANDTQALVAEGPPSWQGYILALSMFAMLLLYSWSFQWFFFEVGKATIVVRTALVSAIYRKSLVLSSQARSRLTLGRLTNLVSSDMSQIERGVTNMLVCITIPIQVIASIIVLVYMIGPASISGWVLVIAFVPVQMWASKYLVGLRRHAVKYTDNRILATREALQGMRVVKFFVWEDTVLEKIQRIRSKEVALIARLNLFRYGLISLALHSPVFASILTFVIFVLTGGKLRTGPVFAVIGIFNSMSVPLSWLPGALAETQNSLVPLQRITEALLEEELDQMPLPQASLDVAVRVSGGCFAWKYQPPSSNTSSRPGLIAHSLDDKFEDDTRIQNTGVALQSYHFPADQDAASIEEDPGSFSLSRINIEIQHGSLVAVIGGVGSGKSSLMSALVSEMKRVSGTLAFGGSLGYAPQVPWVMNSTIRDNIIFGLPFDEDKYLNVIEACALEVDLAALPTGDLTEIGERGVTLSGGQKQRISIARAAYSDSDITLLDDCLSAVDTRVSRIIFKHCIKGFLSRKTRILITNSLDYLPAFDFIITLDQGRIVEQGSFANLMALEGVTAAMFNSFMSNDQEAINRARAAAMYTTDSSFHTATPIKVLSKDNDHDRLYDFSNIYGHAETSLPESASASVSESASASASASALALVKNNTGVNNFGTSGSTSGSSSLISGTSGNCNDKDKTMPTNPSKPKQRKNKHRVAEKLMSDEERLTGQISISTYLAYIHAGGGFALFSMVLLCLAISQGCRVGSDFWMRLWIRHRHDAGAIHTYIWVYTLLGGLQLLWFGLFSVLLVATVYKSSKWLHSRALHRVAHSPMSFFDTTPLGRILNRFTRDVDSLDLALCDFFRQFYQNISRSIGSFVSISILVPIFLIPLVPLFSLSWALIYVYLRTSVEIQRVAAISRSPLYSHYAETLQGLATIRAFNAQNRYVGRIEKALDDANRPQWYALVVQNWVWLRVDLLSHLLSLAVCLIIVAQPDRWDAAAVGLLLVQATQMGAYVTYAGRGWTELQNNMNSVERINYYATELEQEPGYNGSDTEREPGCNVLGPVAPPPAPSTWPERGTIIIRDLSMCYRRGLPLVLKGINMEVYDGEKIGVVGRSGAGKSSLISALFRLTEPSSGRVFIDAVDIQTLHLSRLRKAIGILPQDPVLFDGTLRTNLDPFHEFSDTEIWDMLDQVCMRSQVALQPARLDMAIGEGGDGLSVGQRQLLCLARVLLRRPRILVLDEATANVDHETDAAIQRVVLSRAQGMTVISIAHRLQTIINYDKVFVVDDGRVVESGTPIALLERHLHPELNDIEVSSNNEQPSVFYNMVREMDDDALKYMLTQARAAEDRRRAGL